MSEYNVSVYTVPDNDLEIRHLSANNKMVKPEIWDFISSLFNQLPKKQYETTITTVKIEIMLLKNGT